MTSLISTKSYRLELVKEQDLYAIQPTEVCCIVERFQTLDFNTYL